MKDYDFNDLDDDEKLLYLMGEYDVLVNSKYRDEKIESRLTELEKQIEFMINKNPEYKAMYNGTYTKK